MSMCRALVVSVTACLVGLTVATALHAQSPLAAAAATEAKRRAEAGKATKTITTADLPASARSVPYTPPPPGTPPSFKDCLEIGPFDSSVLSSNKTFVELGWKVDVVNRCAEPFAVHVRFAIADNKEFELDSDTEDIVAPGFGTGKARGTMLVSPVEKAMRLSHQAVNISPR